jgi:hypothetical protein
MQERYGVVRLVRFRAKEEGSQRVAPLTFTIDFQILNLKFEFFFHGPIGTPSSNATFVVCPFLIFPFEAPA